ncbi:MAG: hypothetical protein R2791_05735 [Saprospiraceae bacterium]
MEAIQKLIKTIVAEVSIPIIVDTGWKYRAILYRNTRPVSIPIIVDTGWKLYWQFLDEFNKP